MERLGAIIQVHRGSTRLPGKAYKLLGDKPMIDHVVDRVKEAGIDKIVLATNHTKYDYDMCEDAAIRNEVLHSHWCKDWDVLGRLVKAAKEHGITRVIRVCSDNPFLNTYSLQRLVHCWKDSDVIEFKHRNAIRGYTFNVLERAEKATEYKPSILREHVKIIVDHSILQLKESIDTQEDFDKVRDWYGNK